MAESGLASRVQGFKGLLLHTFFLEGSGFLEIIFCIWDIAIACRFFVFRFFTVFDVRCRATVYLYYFHLFRGGQWLEAEGQRVWWCMVMTTRSLVFSLCDCLFITFVL